MARDLKISNAFILGLPSLKKELFSPRNLTITGLALIAIAAAVYYLCRRAGPDSPLKPATSHRDKPQAPKKTPSGDGAQPPLNQAPESRAEHQPSTPALSKTINFSSQPTSHLEKRFAVLRLQEKYDYQNSCQVPCERDRYSTVLPFQNNVFVFQDTQLYFNASRILNNRAIACQGPKNFEHKRFWRMAWEFEAAAVVMVTDVFENNTEKCSWYLPEDKDHKLPDANENDLPQHLDPIVTQCSARAKLTSDSVSGVFHREIEIQHGNDKKLVTHYHFEGWKDGQAAPPRLLAALVGSVYDRFYSQDQRIIVHCSAGIGRTGTFLATLEAYAQLKSAERQNLPLDFIERIVIRLRSIEEGRMGMVQTPAQYILIHEALALLDPNFHNQFCMMLDTPS